MHCYWVPGRTQTVHAMNRDDIIRSSRWGRGPIQLLALSLVLYALTGCANLPKRPTLSPLLPWHLSYSMDNVPYLLTGEGATTVVIEMGTAARMGEWQRLAKKISQDQRVLLYARAGATNGQSVAGGIAAADVVTDLASLLRELEIMGPLLLVGHSFSAIYVQTFARRYPDRIAGVLLLDPATPNLDRAMWPGVNQPSMSLLTSLGGRQQVKAEQAGRRQSVTQMAASGPFPPKPLMVLSAGKTFRGRHKTQYTKVVLKEHRRIARQSPLGIHMVVAQSSHNLHEDVPDIIVQLIKDILTPPADLQSVPTKM